MGRESSHTRNRLLPLKPGHTVARKALLARNTTFLLALLDKQTDVLL